KTAEPQRTHIQSTGLPAVPHQRAATAVPATTTYRASAQLSVKTGGRYSRMKSATENRHAQAAIASVVAASRPPGLPAPRSAASATSASALQPIVTLVADHAKAMEIGRASCRERVQSSEVAG